MGSCGKSSQQAALTSYEEYLYLLEWKKKEATQKWEMVRWLGWYEEQLNPYVKEGHKHKKPQDIFTLEGENKAENKRTSGRIEEGTIEQLNAIYAHYLSHKNKS